MNLNFLGLSLVMQAKPKSLIDTYKMPEGIVSIFGLGFFISNFYT